MVTFNYHFVGGRDVGTSPVSYGMFSEEGDEKVAAAVLRFLNAAGPLATSEGLTTPEQRHKAIQDASI